MNMANKPSSKYKKEIKETLKLAAKYGFIKKNKSEITLHKSFKEVLETFPTHDLYRLSAESGYSPDSIAFCGMVQVQLSKHNQEDNDELADKIMLLIRKFPEVQSKLDNIKNPQGESSPTYIG